MQKTSLCEKSKLCIFLKSNLVHVVCNNLDLFDYVAGKISDKNEQAASAKEISLTKMLIAVSVLFIVCCVPVISVHLAMYFIPTLHMQLGNFLMNITGWLE